MGPVRLLVSFIVLGLMTLDVGSAWAQAAPAPAAPEQAAPRQPRTRTAPEPRTTGGLFGGHHPVDPNHPDRPAQRLTFDLDLAGGYDQNFGIEEDTIANSGVQQSGAIGTAYGGFAYRVGTSHNYLDSSVR